MKINILYLFSLVCILIFFSSCEEKQTDIEVTKEKEVKESELFSYELPKRLLKILKLNETY